VRGAEAHRRDRMPNKRMPVRRKATGLVARRPLLQAVVAGNRPDAGHDGRARKGADVGR